MRHRQAGNHQRTRDCQDDPAGIAAKFQSKGLRLIVNHEVAGADAGGPPVLIDTDFAVADEIQHEMVARVLADLDGAAGDLDPPIRKGR